MKEGMTFKKLHHGMNSFPGAMDIINTMDPGQLKKLPKDFWDECEDFSYWLSICHFGEGAVRKLALKKLEKIDTTFEHWIKICSNEDYGTDLYELSFKMIKRVAGSSLEWWIDTYKKALSESASKRVFLANACLKKMRGLENSGSEDDFNHWLEIHHNAGDVPLGNLSLDMLASMAGDDINRWMEICMISPDKSGFQISVMMKIRELLVKSAENK